MTSPASWDQYKKPLSLSLGITALVWILLFILVIFDPSRHKQAAQAKSNEDSSNATSQACFLWTFSNPTVMSSQITCSLHA